MKQEVSVLKESVKTALTCLVKSLLPWMKVWQSFFSNSCSAFQVSAHVFAESKQLLWYPPRSMNAGCRLFWWRWLYMLMFVYNNSYTGFRLLKCVRCFTDIFSNLRPRLISAGGPSRCASSSAHPLLSGTGSLPFSIRERCAPSATPWGWLRVT